MKQILQSYRDGRLWLEDVPAPACPEKGLLVQTGRSVISAGTERMLVDLARKSLLGKAMERPELVRKVLQKARTEGVFSAAEKVFAKLDNPIPLGYSCVGRVIEIGANVAGCTPGDRVACAGAGIANHAEINAVPLNLAAAVPDNVSDDDAAFTTIGTIALQGIRQADMRIGDVVCVIGLGLIGLLSVQMAKASGCLVIGFDPSTVRCAMAKQLGADAACSDPQDFRESIRSITGRNGADCALIAAATESNAPVLTAIDVCRLRGRVIVVGAVRTDIPRDEAYRKELDIRFSMSYGPGRYDNAYEQDGVDYPYAYVRWTEQRNMQAFLQLVSEGKVTPSVMISHRFTLDIAAAAYDLLRKRRDSDGGSDVLAIILDYPQSASDTVIRRIDSVHPIESEGESHPGLSFIGAGNFAAGTLIPAFRKIGNVNLRGVCTIRGATSATAVKRFGFGFATTDVSEVLKDDATRAVVIATRHSTHAGLVCRCLEAGKHVFVEKPLCLTMQELDEISRLAERSNKLLQIGYNRRFSKHAKAVKDVFNNSGPVSILYRIIAGRLPDDSWIIHPEEGGDRIVGEMCHFVDLCGFIAGSRVKNVYALRTGNDGIDCSISATLNYENGSVAVIQYVVDGATELPKEYVEISAGQRTAVIDNFRKTRFYGVKCKSVSGTDKGISGEVQAFVDCLQNGGEPPVSWLELRHSTRVTFAVRESVQNQTGIELA